MKNILKILYLKIFVLLRRYKNNFFGPFPFSRIKMYEQLNSIFSYRSSNRNILEIGGFISHPKKFLRPYNQYITININSRAHIQMDGHYLGFRSNFFDVVLIDQVLEHVQNPIKVLKESYRVLQSGGYIIVTVPFMLPIHDSSSDYWRFSEDGLRIMLTEAGFHDIKTDSWGNKAAIIAYMKYSYVGTCSKLELRKILKSENDKIFPLMCWGIGNKRNNTI